MEMLFGLFGGGMSFVHGLIGGSAWWGAVCVRHPKRAWGIASFATTGVNLLGSIYTEWFAVPSEYQGNIVDLTGRSGRIAVDGNVYPGSKNDLTFVLYSTNKEPIAFTRRVRFEGVLHGGVNIAFTFRRLPKPVDVSTVGKQMQAAKRGTAIGRML